jgi:hypothetical protein
MDSTSSVAALPTYPSLLDDGLGQDGLGPTMQTNPEISFTQPVASRPIDQPSGDTDGDGDGDDSAVGAFGPNSDDSTRTFSYDGELGIPRPL